MRHFFPFFSRPVLVPGLVPCLHCEGTEAFHIGGKAKLNVDIKNLIDRDLAKIFLTKWNGLCARCGLSQDYVRFSREEIARYCMQMISKDRAVSEEQLSAYPLPNEYIKSFDSMYFKTRLLRWKSFFREKNFSPKNTLFIRPMYGAAPLFIRETYGSRVSGLEVSDVCRKTVEDRVTDYVSLSGNIHGYFTGNFLYSNPFCAIFVFHTLCHSCDLSGMLMNLKALLKPGGYIILSHEINNKYENPFHTIYFSEWTLFQILNFHFSQVWVLRDCDDVSVSALKNLSRFGDNPDFVVSG